MKHMKIIACIGWVVIATLTPASLSHAKGDKRAKSPAKVKTYWFTGQVKSVDSDTGDTSILFHIESGNTSLDQFRILFDKKIGKATHAWWFTPWGRDIKLPKKSLILKHMPKQGSQVRVEFDHDVPKDSESIGVPKNPESIEVIRLLSVVAQKGSNTASAKK